MCQEPLSLYTQRTLAGTMHNLIYYRIDLLYIHIHNWENIFFLEELLFGDNEQSFCFLYAFSSIYSFREFVF